MDLLSQQADRAKKTVATASALSLSAVKQDKQRDNLGQIRNQRDHVAEKLKAIVQQRSLAQNQILNISTITAEMRMGTLH
jgi:flagellar biosynthesis chaperone FliJ